MLNPAFYLDASARRCPDAILLVHNGRRYTYREVHQHANRIAHGLRDAGIRPGDAVALCCSNRPGFLSAYYGILKTGGKVVVLTTGLKRRDISEQLQDSGAQAFFCFDGFDDVAFAEMALSAAASTEAGSRSWLVPSDPNALSKISGVPSIANLMDGHPSEFATVGCPAEQTALVPYTSGTTGRPKGVEITHANIASMVMLNLSLAEWDLGRVRLVANPLYHVMGQIASLNLPVLCGQRLVLVERFDAEKVWRLVADEGITYMAGIPTLYKALLDHAQHADEQRIRSSLRLCGTGAAPMRPEWSEEFQERFGASILPGYGATETTAVVTWNCPFDRLKADSVGRPVPGVEVRLEVGTQRTNGPGVQGEIIVRSPGVMKGYLGRPEATEHALRDGWYHTDDVGVFDEDGYLYMLARCDEMILRRDANVAPSGIEEVMLEHPSVAEAAVIGVASTTVANDIIAFLVPKAGHSIDIETFRHWLASELPDDQFPDGIHVLSSFPKTGSGKIVKHELVRAAAGLAASAAA